MSLTQQAQQKLSGNKSYIAGGGLAATGAADLYAGGMPTYADPTAGGGLEALLLGLGMMALRAAISKLMASIEELKNAQSS